MKSKVRFLFTIVMIMALVMTYTGVSFAAEGIDELTDEAAVSGLNAAEPAVTDEPVGEEPVSASAVPDEVADDEAAPGEVAAQPEAQPAEVQAAADGNDADVQESDDPEPGTEPATKGEGDSEPEAVDISGLNIEYTAEYFAYDGNAKEPEVTLMDGDKKLVKDQDYTVTYSNNKNAGTATIKIAGIEDAGYTGVISEPFYIIGKASGLKYANSADSRKSSSINVAWSKYTKVEIDGYKVYVGKTQELAKTTTGTSFNVTKYNGKSLAANTSYEIRVAAYAVDEYTGKEVVGPTTLYTMWTTKAAPGKTTLSSAKATLPYVLLKWKKASSYSCDGFQIQYSVNSDFSNAKTVYVSGSTTVSKKMYNLTNNKKYYFRVRSYRKNTGGYAFGAWSSKKYATAKSTGWITSGGKKYYYRNGAKLKGEYTISKEPYYFDDETGEWHGCSRAMWEKIDGSTSKTKYLVSISITDHRVNIYTKKNGKWVVRNQWKCITGYYDTTKWGKKFTPRGSWLTNGKKLKWMRNDGHTCYYATNFYGGCYIHSELYRDTDLEMKKPIDGKLGGSYSSGCVRIYKDNALWVYNNIKKGTRVISYRL